MTTSQYGSARKSEMLKAIVLEIVHVTLAAVPDPGASYQKRLNIGSSRRRSFHFLKAFTAPLDNPILQEMDRSSPINLFSLSLSFSSRERVVLGALIATRHGKLGLGPRESCTIASLSSIDN